MQHYEKTLRQKQTMSRLLIVTAIYISVTFFLSCKKNTVRENSKIITEKNILRKPFKNDSLDYLDSTIVLSKINNSYFDIKNLTEKEAKKCLYKFFKNKGVITHDELKGDLSEPEGTLCVDYDTIYKLKSNKFSGAIITYWLAPAYTNGHCFQPSRAIISNTNEGFKITNENFIPEKFIIDSVGENLSFYGYDFECANNKVLRHFKITLKI